MVERISEIVFSGKLPQVIEVRDLSTDEIRVDRCHEERQPALEIVRCEAPPAVQEPSTAAICGIPFEDMRAWL